MDPAHPLTATLDTALPATYVLSVAAIVGEDALLRWGGHRVSHRGGRASVLSALGSFGGLGLANRLLFVGLMVGAWQLRITDLGLGPGAWLAAFVLYDFMFYTAHRMGHEIRLLWCFHSVHHTAEEMRLTSAIRGSIFDFVYLPWFFVWLPLLGIHPAMVLIVEVFGRLWGVAVHVSPQFVGKLGPLDTLVVTPSVHRVHHGRDLRYLDRNYGEVLTLWDHLFRTYEAEEQAPDYGVLKPIDPGDFREIQFSPWTDLWRDVARAPGVGNKLKYLLYSPGWSHDGPDQRAKVLQRES